MGQHFRLENNELGICLECGLFTAGAEEGCVDYFNSAIKTLKSQLNSELLQTLECAYKLQHFQYYNLSEVESVSILLSLIYYNQTHKFKKNQTKAKEIENYLQNNLFYCKQVLSSVYMFNITAGETNQETTDMAEQYLLEVIQAYSDYVLDLKTIV